MSTGKSALLYPGKETAPSLRMSVDNFVDKAKLTFRKIWIENFDRRQEGYAIKIKYLKSMT
ncbi:hypothetical protein [Janthinobacterium sp. UMAB-56]|uniref:hypothetical protein n=1 Tax=Janthinobacterium sp. UMAB-56 TaxID=1365361 RepID=UPI001C57879F|nr:hypothetical protein [Janthinobacterium sp. UMAB-56]